MSIGQVTSAAASGTVKAGRSQLESGRIWYAFMFLLPMLIVLAIVAGYPLLRTIYYSFTDASLNNIDDAKFIGFANYFSSITIPSTGKVIHTGLLVSSEWWNAVWNTLRFSLVSVFLETLIGLGVALILNQTFAGRGLVRAAILVPWAIPTVVSAKMWAWMLNDQIGIINDMLVRAHIISQPIAWTSNPDTSMFAVLVVDIWKTTPFMSLLILAGLQSIPGDIYEAAYVDGIHPIKQFFRLTLPLVWPALMVAVIFRLLDAMRIFDLVYILTPNSDQTKTMSVIARENMFDFDHFGKGAAMATLLFLTIAVMTAIYMWLGRVRFDGGSR